jgi:hypothetical protein
VGNSQLVSLSPCQVVARMVGSKVFSEKEPTFAGLEVVMMGELTN